MVDYPVGLRFAALTPAGGPTVLGTTESETSFVQGVVNPFGVWRFQVDYTPLRDRMAREFKRLSVSALGGANCFRFPFWDFDEPSFAELAMTVPQTCKVNWSNGETWSNGQAWSAGKPVVPVTAVSAKDTGTITLDLTDWNGVVPSFFGIVGHFAVYSVTGVQSQIGNAATLRVWPPVRKAITTSDYATLRPVLAARISGPAGASWSRQTEVMSGTRLDMIEVPDETVRTYVTED